MIPSNIRIDLNQLPSCPICGTRPNYFIDDIDHMQITLKGCKHMGRIQTRMYQPADDILTDLISQWENKARYLFNGMKKKRRFNKKNRNMLTKRSLIPRRSVRKDKRDESKHRISFSRLSPNGLDAWSMSVEDFTNAMTKFEECKNTKPEVWDV